MWQQLKQVGTTYYTRPAFWLLGGLSALFGFMMMMAVTGAPKHTREDFSFMVGMAAYPLAILIATHAKLQFAHPRSRLMPGFAAPHLFWAVVGILLAAVGLPLLQAQSTATHPLPILCWCGCLVASVVWAFHYNSPTASLLALAIFGSFAMEAGRNFWGFSAPQASDSAPLYLWPMLAVAWGALATWLVRLAGLHEEMDEYEFQLPLSNWDRSPRSARLEGRRFRLAERSRLWRISRWLVDWWHDRIAIRNQRGTATRQFLWHYGFSATPGYIHAVWAAVFILAMGMIMEAFAQPHAHDGDLMMITCFSLLLPTVLNIGSLVQRWPRLGSEMLLPHTREQWIDGLLRALGRETALGAAAMQLTLVLMCMIWFPEQVTFGAVVGYLLLASSMTYLNTAVTTWIASRYQGLMGFFFTCALFLPLLGVFKLWLGLRQSNGDGISVLLAAPIAWAGWWAMRRARQRWLEVELGGTSRGWFFRGCG